MSDLKIAVELEDEDGSAYLRLRLGKVAKTRRITDKINVDFNADGEVLGVEFIFYGLRSASIKLFEGNGISDEDRREIFKLLILKGSSFDSKPAGVWRIPKTMFQSSAPQPIFA